MKTLRFAARADSAALAVIWSEARKAHVHYNELITRSNHRRAAIPYSTSDRGRDLGARLRRIHAIKRALQAATNAAACRKVKLPAAYVARHKAAMQRVKAAIAALPKDPLYERVRDELAQLREQRGKGRIPNAEQAQWDARMLACAAQHPTLLARVQADQQRRLDERETRARSGTHCSTYMLTEDAARRAIASSGRAARRRFLPLRTQHRIGIGVVSNNGQHVPWSELPMEDAASGWGTHDLRAVISGQPVTLRFKQHRRARQSWAADDPRHRLHLVPEDAVVHTAWAQLVRRANKWDLELCLSVDMPTEPTRTGDRSIGIDAGYRAIGEHSVRAASTSAGEHIETPPRYLDRVRQSEDLHSLADRMTREMWEACYGAVPMHAGREWSVRRLHRTIMVAPYVRQVVGGRDAGERWKAGERTHDVYRLQHRHLMQWSDALREKSRRARLNHYRVTSARLAREHDAIVVESLRLDNMARSRIAGGRRVDAAPSELRAALKAAASTYGARHVEVPAYNTSQTCSACDVVHPVGTARDGEAFACPSCGFVAHADINAAVNIRARAIASGEVPRENPQPLEKPETAIVSSPSAAKKRKPKRAAPHARARKQLALEFHAPNKRKAS